MVTGTCQGKSIVQRTPDWDDVPSAITLRLLKELYEADGDTETELERVSLDHDASPADSVSSGVDTKCTKSDSEYD
jgi:hypothetical protein